MIHAFSFVCSTHTYVNVLHLMLKLCYYDFLVNKGIDLRDSIHLPLILVYYISKDVFPTSVVVWYPLPTTFPFIIIKSQYTVWNTIISLLYPKFFYFTDIMVICVIYYHYCQPLVPLCRSFTKHYTIIILVLSVSLY